MDNSANIIGQAAKEVVEQAKKSGKVIAEEDLKFADDKDVKTKFARVKHQFIHMNLYMLYSVWL